MFLRALLLLFGAFLLLPGACSLGFMGIFISGGLGNDSGMIAPLTALWLFCFLVSFGGVMMIRRAIWPRRSAPRDPPT